MNENSRLIVADDHFNVVNGKNTRTINPPLYTGSTILFDSYEDFSRAVNGEYPGIVYGTDRLPTQRAFEEALMYLEGGALTRTFQSGINAIIQTFLAFTESGDHVLVCDNVYAPTAAFCRSVLAKYQVEVDFIPPATGAEIEQFIKPNTRLIFLESPGSNTFEIQDLSAITTIARDRKIITVLDNTWATPLFLKPFQLGIDVSIHSVSKYISGHSDVLLGTVSVNDQYAERFNDFYQVMETFASPQDCYLALRGLKTLSLRMQHHQQAALILAHWLEQHPLVETVIHPALPSHPQHRLWLRDFTGSSGLFSFVLKGDPSEEQVGRFLNRLECFGLGFSWGGFKSLITVGKYPRNQRSHYTDRYVFRLNIGLEDVQDLQNDLACGLEEAGK